MPAPNTITKEILLQRLKEQEEAHKQKRLEILQRVKTLEARKKFVGELKAWLTRRKLTNADLLAMYRDLMPKRGDAPVKSKKPLQPGEPIKRKTSGELLVDEMRRQRMVEVSVDQIRTLCGNIGFSATSYHHLVANAIKGGHLRKGDRDGNGFKYVVTGGPSKVVIKPGRVPKLIPGKIHGDPAFCKAIREARQAKGWDTTQMGKKVGVSSASISNWETGRYTPVEASRLKVLKLLDLPEDLGAAATAAAHDRMGNVHRKPAPAANGAAAP